MAVDNTGKDRPAIIDDTEVSVDDVIVVPESSEDKIDKSVAEDVEQISKNIAIGRREAYYEDGRNVISVIINAISVRINMPRGTVKALLACLAALLVVVVMLVWNGKGGDDSTELALDTSTQREYSTGEEGSKAVNSKRSASGMDYVIISDRYRYSLPDEVVDVEEPDDYYEENETFCNFNNDGDLYTIRSYLLQDTDDELGDIVMRSISQFDGYKPVDEDYIEGRYGKVLRIRFEVTDDNGEFTAVTGYYWYDTGPHVCCLEVSSDGWHEDGVEEKVLDSVYRVDGDGNPDQMNPSDAEETWQEQQKQEAMDSIAKDSMLEQEINSEPPNYPW